MTHPLRTVSYVADIEGSLVIMVHRSVPASPGQQLKLTCHVIDTLDVSHHVLLTIILYNECLCIYLA